MVGFFATQIDNNIGGNQTTAAANTSYTERPILVDLSLVAGPSNFSILKVNSVLFSTSSTAKVPLSVSQIESVSLISFESALRLMEP